MNHDLLIQNYQKVLARIKNLSESNGREVRLVAVSKTKEASLVKVCYDLGQRHFGENYVKEMVEKAGLLPGDVRWHFIGHLQSNKINKLVNIPNLWMIETVDSEKLAKQISIAISNLNRPEPLNILIQVNTSREEQKSGLDRPEAVDLAEKIYKNDNNEYSNIRFKGFMTIGQLEIDPTNDFQCLVDTRGDFCTKLSITNHNDIELSMGMSSDFEKAIEIGSTNVRIGSTIFGERVY